jgi:hypothetical protein
MEEDVSIQWLTHKNKKILHIKYSGLSPKEMKDQILTATQLIVDTNSKENLVISDMIDCYVDNDFIELAKEKGKISLPHCKKSAIVGISGIKKILLKSVNVITSKPRVPFDTMDDAKEWIVK